MIYVQNNKMAKPNCFLVTISFLFLFIFALPSFTQGVVPPSRTFTYINEGDFGDYITEYDATYRVTRIFKSPFQVVFYNTTPNAYTLAIRMGIQRTESIYNWVWEANRGNPVGENATFSLSSNGNLVLADANGRVAWQSNTTNKGVVGFDLLSNGNMVLLDSKGKFVWQSFDYVTDTLLVGQSLRQNGSNKLVSRVSELENKNGPYSMVLEGNKLSLYYTSKNSPRPMLYYNLVFESRVESLTFNSRPEMVEAYSYRLVFKYLVEGGNAEVFLSKTNYNSTSSYLRLGIDGGLRGITYYVLVDHLAWEETFTLFPRDFGRECRLPSRCGEFGLCEDSQCVACPTPKGLVGWSKSCEPPRLTSCKPGDFEYYKLEGVNHFLSRYTSGSGPMREEQCSKRCTSDCKCLGYFFKQLESRCWIVYDLMTLTRVNNVTHVGYIKTPIVH